MLNSPRVNPIHFLSEFSNSDYAQKFNISDITFLQFSSINTFQNVVVRLKNRLGTVVKNYVTSVTEVDTDESIIYFYNIEIRFSNLEQGCYYLELEFAGCTYFSNFIELQNEHDNTVLLQYFNSENSFDTNFNIPVIYSLRVEGGFLMKSYSPKSDDNSYNDIGLNFSLLQSSAYSTARLNVGYQLGIPDWLHDRINRAFSCDNLFIDSIKYTKYEGGSWSANEEDGVTNRSWEIELVREDENISQVIECKQKEGSWEDHECLQDGFYLRSYLLQENINIVFEQGVNGKQFNVLSTYNREKIAFEILSNQNYWISVSIYDDNLFIDVEDGMSRLGEVVLKQNATNKILNLTISQ